jgi:hypothetical protein
LQSVDQSLLRQDSHILVEELFSPPARLSSLNSTVLRI